MAVDTFLGLTNRVLNAFNEVELDSVTFGSSIGFHTEAKNAVNQGIFDVYSHENVRWPFLQTSLTFATTRGIISYPADPTVIATDWGSFRIKRPSFNIVSLTQVAGVATAVTADPHNLATNDYLFIDGAVPEGYNSDGIPITVVDATTFTYSVNSGLASPATGTITAKSNTVKYKKLNIIDIDEYRRSYANSVENMTSGGYMTPEGVVRAQNNSVIVFNPADRVYTIEYDAFAMPGRLEDFDDTHLIPEQFEQAAVDFALMYAYMFRDNMEQAKIAEDRGLARVRRMRKDLVPVQENVNYDGASV